MRWRSHLFIICYQISAVVPSTLVMSHGGIIKIPYLRWRSSFYLELLTCRSHQTPCKGRRSTTTTWEGGALGGEGGRKEPATTINAGASSWWGSFTQCGGTPRMMAAAARRCPCPSPHPWRRGLVSRWSSRTREAQWEEEQTANLSGAHLIFQANDQNRRDNFEK